MNDAMTVCKFQGKKCCSAYTRYMNMVVLLQCSINVKITTLRNHRIFVKKEDIS